MIARSWTATATLEGARAYVAFFQKTLTPQLDRIEGHRGAMVLSRARPETGDVELTIFTFWDSMEAVARFAGETPSRAVVEPEARSMLGSFDERVWHAEVAVDSIRLKG